MRFERKGVRAIEQIRWGRKKLITIWTSESDNRLFKLACTQGAPNNWGSHRLMCVRNRFGVYHLIYAKVANCADKLPLSYLTYFPLPLSIS